MIAFSEDPVTAEQQMSAIIYYMVTFGFIDGTFDAREQNAVRQWIRALVDLRVRAMGLNARDSFEHGEQPMAFVLARLKLRCFELFKSFDTKSQEGLLFIVDRLLEADGVVHPEEKRFRDELVALLQRRDPTPPPRATASLPAPPTIAPQRRMTGAM